MGLWNWFLNLFGKGEPPKSEDDKPLISLVLLLAPRYSMTACYKLINKA